MAEPAKEAPKPAEGEEKISPAELKKRAKAEKQARRAAQKGEGAPAGGPPTANGAPTGERSSNQQGQKGQQQQKQGGQDKAQQHKRTGSQAQQAMPIRRRPSQGGPALAAALAASSVATPKEPKKENKQVELFSHLYTQPRRHTVEGVSKDVHPAVLALGFQMSSYEICGSSARCVAMLLAFK